MHEPFSMAEIEGRVDFLCRHFGLPGILTGTDLVSGVKYRRIEPCSPNIFFRAHVLGPGNEAEPPIVDAWTQNGVRSRHLTFVRSFVLPVNPDGMTAHVSVKFKTMNALAPECHVLEALRALESMRRSLVLERATFVGDWTIWLLLPTTVSRLEALAIAEEIQGQLRAQGIRDSDYQIPICMDAPESLPLPFPFFGGKFFGEMFEVLKNGELTRLKLDKFHSGLEGPAHWDSLDAAFFESWANRFGNKWVRAGMLQELSDIAHPIEHPAVIQMGKALKRYAASNEGCRILESRRSGKSHVFRLKQGSQSEAETNGGENRDAAEITSGT